MGEQVAARFQWGYSSVGESACLDKHEVDGSTSAHYEYLQLKYMVSND